VEQQLLPTGKTATNRRNERKWFSLNYMIFGTVMPRSPYRPWADKERSLFRAPPVPFNMGWYMLFAIAGIFLILGILGLAAFFCGREQLQAMLRDGDVLGRPPVRRAHSQ
jgi:hypothetical protein